MLSGSEFIERKPLMMHTCTWALRSVPRVLKPVRIRFLPCTRAISRRGLAWQVSPMYSSGRAADGPRRATFAYEAEKGVGPFFLHFEARIGRCIISCRARVPGADGQGLQIAARFRHRAFFKALTIASVLARSL